MKILLIGNNGREHAIAQALDKNKNEIFVFANARNPGILSHSKDMQIGKLDDLSAISKYAQKINPDFAVIGPENPLAAGVVDMLDGHNIKSFGPTKELAQLESSKGFTRNLMKKYRIPGLPKFSVCKTKKEISEIISELNEFVIKPDGLTGGKGVMVFGDHFNTKSEGEKIAIGYLTNGPVIIEEKLDGEEFSYMFISDGKRIFPCPIVQDHKRLLDGDIGPNTGGMGSYSFETHSLPFLEKDDIKSANHITSLVQKALKKEIGKYVGVMYGGFMATKDSVKLIEYNARFGDPEAMNVLPIMESDFSQVCLNAIEGKLKELTFLKKATVCKYLVPNGYPTNPIKAEIKVPLGNYYFASVSENNGKLNLLGSRAIGCVGIANNIILAEKDSENLANAITAPLFHRKDIATQKLIAKRVNHMRLIRYGN